MLAFLFGFLFVSETHAEIVERIVAVVNDQIITEQDLGRFSVKLKSGGMVDDLLVSDPQSLLADKNLLVKHMIDEKIIDSEVRRQNLEVTVERVEQEIRSISSRNKIDRNQLRQALKEQGVSFSEYQDFIKHRLERQSLVEKAITSKIKISDEEVASYFLTHKKTSGNEVYEYVLSHIVFLPKLGDVKGAEQRAQETLTKLKNGGVFDQLASQYTEDPSFSGSASLGTFKSGEFSKEMEAAVKGLSPGGFSDLVRSKNGFHILRMDAKRLIADPEFEKNKEEVRNLLYQAAFKKQFNFWMDQRRAEAFIRVN